MKDTFLSIDLDYWDCIYDFRRNKKFSINRYDLFKEIYNRKIPFQVYFNHDEMVDQINESKCNKIINIDFHSDLVDKKDFILCGLNEGTVFNAIHDFEEKEYIWLMPYRKVGIVNELGRCDQDNYNEENCWIKENFIYKNQIKSAGSKWLKLDDVKEIGICFSQNWVTKETYNFILNNFITDEKWKHIIEKINNEKKPIIL